ncbi:hypothetical protein [Leuconostoc pseudomesenteroides]|uniref:hypothetical protein n=1 Tax=Leuconostoc pseudomesenteroides TaxID=33968 RepID=UPI0016647EBD|nr:hypothetical protein [Leuconostoc pseudomesenteroides]
MNQSEIIYYEQPVNDDGNVLVADFTAQRNNGVVQNIAVSVNTVAGYQANKDRVITAFDDFLTAIQSETVQVPDETTPIESESESDSASDSQSDSDSQSESESETDSANDSTSDSTSALSQ